MVLVKRRRPVGYIVVVVVVVRIYFDLEEEGIGEGRDRGEFQEKGINQSTVFRRTGRLSEG